MAKRPKRGDEQPEAGRQASTTRLDRLEKRADEAATPTQAKRCRARKNGLRQQDASSEVRDLSRVAEAIARAEEAPRVMMAMPGQTARLVTIEQ